MSKTSLRVMFINLENLFSPGNTFYGQEYTPAQYADKVAWIGNRIAEGQVHVVAMSELGDDSTKCVQDVIAAANLADSGAWTNTWGAFQFEHRADPSPRAPRIRTALISRFPLTNTDSITDFPDGFEVDFFDVDADNEDDRSNWNSIPLSQFSRPIAKATVNPPDKTPFNIFVVHLKSKRPKVLRA